MNTDSDSKRIKAVICVNNKLPRAKAESLRRLLEGRGVQVLLVASDDDTGSSEAAALALAGKPVIYRSLFDGRPSDPRNAYGFGPFLTPYDAPPYGCIESTVCHFQDPLGITVMGTRQPEGCTLTPQEVLDSCKEMVACKNWRRYKGVRPPRCDGGRGCQACKLKYKVSVKKQELKKKNKLKCICGAGLMAQTHFHSGPCLRRNF